MTEQEELGLRAVKAFPDLFPEHWKHALVEGSETANICYKCHTTFDIGDELANGLCVEPGKPIDINDWNVAHKLGAACDWMLFEDALLSLYRDYCKKGVEDKTGFVNYFGWFTHKLTSTDYILAACKAKEQSK